MIEFIEKEVEEDCENYLTILDVEDDQFFIDQFGRLCQKIAEYSFNVIASESGAPLALDTEIMYEDEPIEKILDKVTKIKFK